MDPDRFVGLNRVVVGTVVGNNHPAYRAVDVAAEA